MPLNPSSILAHNFEEKRVDLTAHSAMLYALSIGLGADPTNMDELRFVYERELEIFPTMSVVLGHPGNWMIDPAHGITRSKIVHGAQQFTIHRPLTPGMTLIATNRVSQIIDKGRAKGALLILNRDLYSTNGELLSNSESQVFARADGGFGGTTDGAPAFLSLPARKPDVTQTIKTAENAALLYRLNGDYNPLHSDPDFAKSAGFEQPILHGLCTYGIAGVALSRHMGFGSGSRLAGMQARFSRPVIPGETLQVDIWDEEGMPFCVRVEDRVVLDGGRALFAPIS